MDEEQVARCATELTHFKQLWEDAAHQACYERMRAENCAMGLRRARHNPIGWDWGCRGKLLNIPSEDESPQYGPCAERFEDCPLPLRGLKGTRWTNQLRRR